MKQLPRVSVCMITYGHEQFIEQAVNSVLMQDCNFEIELILANDCSPDKTDEVINSVLKSHPRASIINYIRHEKNIGMMPNFIFALQKCKGKYIALCEGDDYWTDPLKLQKQVDFLEENHDCNLCFHRANMLRNSELTLHPIPSLFNKEPFYYEELLRHYNFITTASVVFRKKEDFKIPNWIKSLPFGDLGLYKIVSDNEKIVCIDEVMSVYRIHDNGVWSGLKPIEAESKYLDFYLKLFFFLNQKERKIVSLKIKEKLFKIASFKYPKNSKMKQFYYFINSIKYFKYL